MEGAISFLSNLRGDWAHIVDIKTGKIVEFDSTKDGKWVQMYEGL